MVRLGFFYIECFIVAGGIAPAGATRGQWKQTNVCGRPLDPFGVRPTSYFWDGGSTIIELTETSCFGGWQWGGGMEYPHDTGKREKRQAGERGKFCEND